MVLSNAALATSWVLFVVARWRVASVALPAAAICGGVRQAVWGSAALLPIPTHSGYYVDASVLNGFVAASIFVLAILLNGIMADYKESERIPGEIEAAFQALLAHVLVSARAKKFEPLPELRALRSMLRTVARCVDKSAPYAQCVRELMAADVDLIAALDSHGVMAPHYTGFTNIIRSRLGRAHVISDTTFLLPFYSLFDTLVTIVHILLVITNFTSHYAGVTNACVFSFLFVYLGVLVRTSTTPLATRIATRSAAWTRRAACRSPCRAPSPTPAPLTSRSSLSASRPCSAPSSSASANPSLRRRTAFAPARARSRARARARAAFSLSRASPAR